jgi:hypothetical protein
MNPGGGDSEQGEGYELCDGCQQAYPASELFLIGDGSIKVYHTCRAQATTIMREQSTWVRCCGSLPSSPIQGH